MRIRVGQIPYLNSWIFYHGMSTDAVNLISLVPKALSSAALGVSVDAAPIPLVTSFELEDLYEPLGDYCIATVGRARSILLFSKCPIGELNGAVVGVTDETVTSVRLLKILLNQRVQVQPHSYVSLHHPCDAFLLIGDQALKSREGVTSYPYCYDLGQEWYEWTGLPFVFARWMVRRGLERSVANSFLELLGNCLSEGLRRLDQIGDSRDDLGMSSEEIMEYVRAFRYRLGPEDMLAIDTFKNMLLADSVDGRSMFETRQSL